jgi:hypothetical protein
MTSEVTVDQNLQGATTKQAAAADGVAAIPAEAVTSNEQATDESKHKHLHAPIHLEPTPRKKTWGEKMFNLGVYGGFALGGNELLGTWTMVKAKHGFLQNIYNSFTKLFTQHAGKAFVPKYITSGRMPATLFACISGNFMVPPIMYYENHKGEKVRKLDRKHYGDRCNTDPEIIAAHKEMDEAPKQSWGSLWKGRVATVFAAVGVDSLIGWDGAPTTKLFKKNTTYQRFASYDRIVNEASEGAVKLFNVSEKAKPTFLKWANQGGSLFTLSALLTVLFYASSKIFAEKRDEKIERRQPHASNSGTQADTISPDEAALETTLTSMADKPQAKVTATTHDQMLLHEPQHAHGAHA